MENEIRNDFLPVNETEEMNLSKILDDALIKATDTYKTPPNAVVEDLLKRLPGVEVDSDGKSPPTAKKSQRY